MTQAIEKRTEPEQGLAEQLWGRERLEVLRQQIAPGASDAELDLFATVCRRTRLDPFAKQIWSIPRRRKVKDGNREFWESYQVIQIGVHGLRLIAQRSREYAGEDGPYWCGPDGEWVDVWISDKDPTAARVGVMRKGFSRPLYSVAVWERAVQKTSEGRPMALWATRGPEQLALAAERDALRRAFPLETSEVEVVMDEAEQSDLAQRYTEIFGDEE
ncbi:MAG TPA: recombinase RecT, partial [Chloroflexota bacterium]|nr:recombinase RecT [Chloroflexota bacterium]